MLSLVCTGSQLSNHDPWTKTLATILFRKPPLHQTTPKLATIFCTVFATIFCSFSLTHESKVWSGLPLFSIKPSPSSSHFSAVAITALGFVKGIIFTFLLDIFFGVSERLPVGWYRGIQFAGTIVDIHKRHIFWRTTFQMLSPESRKWSWDKTPALCGVNPYCIAPHLFVVISCKGLFWSNFNWSNGPTHSNHIGLPLNLMIFYLQILSKMCLFMACEKRKLWLHHQRMTHFCSHAITIDRMHTAQLVCTMHSLADMSNLNKSHICNTNYNKSHTCKTNLRLRSLHCDTSWIL